VTVRSGGDPGREVDGAPATLSRYLARLRLDRRPVFDVDGFRELHRAHLVHVAFENLDIHLGRPISLDRDDVLAKIVTHGRGGFCYELNSSFAWLLAELGLRVELLQAQVYGDDGALSPPFDHLALRVALDGERYLADVGFGTNFTYPLRLDAPGPQADPVGAFELRPAPGEGSEGADAWDMLQDGRPTYRLDGRPRAIDEFVPMCTYHQTSPDSHFTQGPVCTRLRPDGGRVTLAGATLIETAADGTRTEHRLDRQALEAAYARHFGYGPPLVPQAPAG
jgi:N-hydroxyarylamine O-acetyltransferase